MPQRITDRMARALERPPSGNKIYYDDEVAGFGIRITAAGARAFVINYRRRADGLERRWTIGGYPSWSASAARDEAKRLRREIDLGGDPVGADREQRGAPTMADLCARFLEEHVAKQRPHTQSDYRSMVRNDILPVLGRLKVALVEFEHVERLHAAITKRAPVRANRVAAVLSKMFRLAVRWKMRTDNPAAGLERNREHLRRRYLSADELARLLEALNRHSNQDVADIVRLMLLTGCRRGEALNATWVQFDLTAGVWSKPPSSTKQKAHHQVPLNAPARQLLSRLSEQATGPYVFPGRSGRPRGNINSDWRHILKAAKITEFRLHDLRHSFASNLVGAGFSLPVIGAMLGHSQPSTTARYAHLAHDPLREAAERVGAIISGKPSAEIKPMKGGRR
jgi:integrase